MQKYGLLQNIFSNRFQPSLPAKHRYALMYSLLSAKRWDSSVQKYNIQGLSNDYYNIILSFFPKDETAKKMLLDREFEIKQCTFVKLYYEDHKVIKSANLANGKQQGDSYTFDKISWYLLGFKAEKKKNYYFEIESQCKYIGLNEIEKDIFVEEVHDYAALPWLTILKPISLLVFVITLIASIFLLTFQSRKSGMNKLKS